MVEAEARIKRWLSVPGSSAALQPIVRNMARLFAPRHRIGVFVATFDNDDRVLLLRHVLHPAAPWGLPGGWLERHERPQDGARREFREETGLDVEIGDIAQLEIESEPEHVTIVFLGRALAGDVRLGAEIADHGWFGEEELPTGTPPFFRTEIRHAVQRAREVDAR